MTAMASLAGVRRRALVTGAAGFIGSHLCERLVDEGWRVVGVDCFTDYYPRGEKEAHLTGLRDSPQFTLLEADLVRNGWQGALQRGDTVFHLAAQAGVRGSFGDSFARYASDNVVATQRVFEAAARAGARRTVWASSSSVYGDAAAYPCSEATTGPAPRSPYGVTKRACEDLAQVYRELGQSITGLRYFTVFGPRQRPDMAIRRICEALVARHSFPVYGDGFQSRDFTYVTDACDATYRAALVPDPSPLYNVGGGEEATLCRVITVLEELLGTTLEVERRPAQKGDVRRTAADVSRARAYLRWSPAVDLRTGLARQLAWVRTVSEQRSVA